MALAESIKQTIGENPATLWNDPSDYMAIGAIASNLLSTDGYLTILPFVSSIKIERGNPWQLQTKTFIPSNQKIQAWASDVPVNMVWNLDSGWESEGWNTSSWNTPSPGLSSIFLDLTIAEI